jgi:hypothetical protein
VSTNAYHLILSDLWMKKRENARLLFPAISSLVTGVLFFYCLWGLFFIKKIFFMDNIDVLILMILNNKFLAPPRFDVDEMDLATGAELNATRSLQFLRERF